MAVPGHENIRALPDFATLVKWSVSINNIAGLSIPPNLNFQCLSSDVPRTEAGQTIDVWVRGHRVRQPGIYASTTSITLTFAETVDNAISNMLSQWRELCWQTKTGIEGERNAVEGTLLLTRMNRQNRPIWTYELIGCFLEDYDPTGSQLDGESGDILRPTLTLSYDYFNDLAGAS